ncbi:diguanylate cyclase (GGDEF) domain-containing protein [Pseudidiomarina planktonica]|uniref:diguanylate cyclase n=1 Tax=Pseudidiomarina planktonica TaxID=1323738 RepID=A0A1Y6G299_9GAMM|nr:GGDEF domain-containing protein [Pseudidiomarina planktonica]SMQ79989.1 diguanylate cyclase (GGDEF) domain-containing protein [Pseudidiomarina planktonica]
MKYWRKHHPDIGVDDPRYHQVSLMYSVLIIMLLYFGLIALLNVTLFDDADIALYDFLGFVMVACVYSYVRYGGNFRVAGWAVIATLIFVLLAFIHLAEGRNYSLLWVTILPPFAFFLLGPRAGIWVTGLVFTYSAWFLYQLLDQQVSANLGLGAFLNFVEVGTAQIFLFRYYERSRIKAYDQLRQTSITDPLTGVYNRLHLDNTLKNLLTRANVSEQPLSVLLLDVDYFKRINDSHGHLVGDDVLVALTKVLQNGTRDLDLVGRWGGEEFLLICPDADAKVAYQVAKRLLEQVRSQPLAHGISITVSIGIATSTTNSTAESMLQVADQYMYEAKAAGRNRIGADQLPAE